MKILKALAHGYLLVDGIGISIYKLENETIAFGQLALLRFFTCDNSFNSSKYNLRLSNMGKYLSKKMLNDPELAVEAELKPIRLFTSSECLQLCRAILSADHDGKLGKNWLFAPKRTQLLLLRFAELGIEKTLKKALKENQQIVEDSFGKHLIRLLAYKY